MKPFSARGLYERVIAKALDMFLEAERKFDDILEAVILGRVEVVYDVVRFIKMGSTRVHLVQLETSEVCQPDERGAFGRDDVVFLFLAEDYVLQPLWSPLGSIFLKERFPTYPLWEPQK